MKPKNPWTDAHLRLKELYEARVPRGMSQKQFGQAYGIGSQSMVAQYLNGTRPLNFEAAAKFATGLRCTIHDISPEMAAALETEILPLVGKVSAASKMAWRRLAAKAAMLLLALGIAVPPPLAEAAATAGQFFDLPPRLCIMLNRQLRAFIRAAVRFVTTPSRFQECCACT